jgi:small-conductance mechanosensitive channel
VGIGFGLQNVVSNFVSRTYYGHSNIDVIMPNQNFIQNHVVNFELCVWLQGEEIIHPKRTTSRFLALIYNALYENGIEIPFPQLALRASLFG